MNKKIIFFDGDGTLWYPKETKRKVAPHWIYKEMADGTYLKHMEVIPGTFSVLKKLKKLGVVIVIVSTHPYGVKKSTKLLDEKVNYFKLDRLAHEWYPAKAEPNGKATVFKVVMKKYGFKKSEAMHVGDSYTYDYLAARSIGIDVGLLDTPYLKRNRLIKKWLIKSLSDLL